ncbi:hypothetical protein BaRGS_00010335 [Batillaria attramentaria]|uniref:Uncharacterized protein n=1 Tax=Batillaria attramentaria TaxID=370345 RepID=A0ABD0LGA2_9CAEN
MVPVVLPAFVGDTLTQLRIAVGFSSPTCGQEPDSPRPTYLANAPWPQRSVERLNVQFLTCVHLGESVNLRSGGSSVQFPTDVFRQKIERSAQCQPQRSVRRLNA